MYKLIQSSANPDKLALTIKGILTALIPVILLVLSVWGFNIGTEEITEVIAQITGIIAGVVILLGLCRKFYFLIKTLFVK